MLSKENESPVKPPKLRKLPEGIKKAILFPIDPLGRKRLGSIPKNILKKEFSLSFLEFFIFEDSVALCPALGAPAAGMCIEMLAANGIEKVLLVGSCGSLDQNYRAGEVVLVHSAVSFCGVTSHYFDKRDEFKVDDEVAAKVTKELTAKGIVVKKAIAATTDAPYRENNTFIQQARDRGGNVVEMEAAAVYSVALHKGIKAAALLVISDSVYKGQWQRGVGLAKYAISMRKILKLIWTLDF